DVFIIRNRNYVRVGDREALEKLLRGKLTLFVDVRAVVGIDRVRSHFFCRRDVRTRYDDALDLRPGRRRGSTNVRRQRREVLSKCVRRDNERDSNAGSESHAQEPELAKSDSDHGFLLWLRLDLT